MKHKQLHWLYQTYQHRCQREIPVNGTSSGSMRGLDKFKVSQLKNVCLMSGLSSTGTKRELIDTIISGLTPSPIFSRIPNNGRSFNILSIDMGIRNFSYTRIQLDKNLPFNRAPLVKEWTKFDVNHWANVSHDKGFEPVKYSEICHNLVEKVLFNPNSEPVDLLMIERQRARSGGSRNILEWVFRVNMFESMLHASVYSKVKQYKEYRTEIISSEPKRMASYWGDNKNKKAKDSKNFRIALMEKWLRESIQGESKIPMFQLEPTNFNISSETIASLSKTRSKSKWINQIILGQSEFIQKIYGTGSISDDTNPKGDDLVDSLLHALAWYEWERNKMIFNLEFGMAPENGIKLCEKLLASHEKRLLI